MQTRTFMQGIGSWIAGLTRRTPKPHEHKWKFTYTDHLGGDRYICETCSSEGARHPHHRMDMKVLKWSDKAKGMLHKHAWCYEYAAGRKADAPKTTPLSIVYSCECGKWAVKHHGEEEYCILKDTNEK